jgi:hypothetical protein
MIKFFCTALLVATLPLVAGSITTLYNTGVDDYGVLLPPGAPDPHYTVIPPNGYPSLASAYVLTDVFCSWDGCPNHTGWIGYVDADSQGAGFFTYQTTFDLTGFDPSTASLGIGWAADDYGSDVLLNGHSLGISDNVWWYLASYTVPSGNPYFLPGENTLDFIVYFDGNADGTKIALSGTADSSSAPEPGGAGLCAIAVAVLALLRRFRAAA